MEPVIRILPEKKFIGKMLTMTLANNRTSELWRGFMPRRKEIMNNLSADVYSIQAYSQLYVKQFNPNAEFKKWAAVEVLNFALVPTEMETITLVGGLYAVFQYKGLSTDTKIFNFIFETWLPHSIYLLDDRPHFEILGDKYKNDDPNSEEEIWIPIKLKE